MLPLYIKISLHDRPKVIIKIQFYSPIQSFLYFYYCYIINKLKWSLINLAPFRRRNFREERIKKKK